MQVQTNAAALTVPVNQLSDDERAQLAKELGYKSIGRELPDGVTLTDIVKSMPSEVRCFPTAASIWNYVFQLSHRATHCLQVFELDHGKAWRSVLTSVVSMAASLYLISISPWYLLPFAWFLSGTAFTGVGLAGQTRAGARGPAHV